MADNLAGAELFVRVCALWLQTLRFFSTSSSASGEILASKLESLGPCCLFFTEGFLFGSLPGSFQDELSFYFLF